MTLIPLFENQAFYREREEQWLHEVLPTITALRVYLTRENNGISVHDRRTFIHPKLGIEVTEMSNGMFYAKDEENKWYIAA